MPQDADQKHSYSGGTFQRKSEALANSKEKKTKTKTKTQMQTQTEKKKKKRKKKRKRKRISALRCTQDATHCFSSSRKKRNFCNPNLAC